jgi:uncharacterized protein YbjT (DUF2867 family)
VLALSRRAEGAASLRAAGVIPVMADLDVRASMRRAGAIAQAVFGLFHYAPPAADGEVDRRTRTLVAALGAARANRARRHKARGRVIGNTAGRTFGRAPLGSGNGAGIVPEHRPQALQFRGGMRQYALWPRRESRQAIPLIYASTTGVYGDCGGALIDETRPVRPTNSRAVRRVSAERLLRAACVCGTVSPSILRIPGIYAADRLPEARLRRGTPALRPEDDVFTSHIQADDLADIAVRALWRGCSQRIYHASDDSRLKMGDYFERVADALGLPRPPRISRAQAEQEIEPMLMSFMRESRQLDNTRLRRELGYRLRYPSVDAFLQRDRVSDA